MSDPHDTQPAGGVPVEGTTVDSQPAGHSGQAAREREQPGPPVQSSGLGQQGQAKPAGARPKPSQLQDLVDEPAKVMRIGTMMKQLLEEVKSAPLDDAARVRLAGIHERSIKELEDGLAPELVEELERITLPFPAHGTPSDAELRIAQAQLVGWLEGLFHGIQTALFAQQMAARAQLEQMRRALPAGRGPVGPEGPPGDGSGGMYL